MTDGIKGAVMYRAWVNSARELIPDAAARCELYDAIFDLYYTGQVRIIDNPVVRAVYTMVKPFVLDDVTRYTARCERNRQNALAKRVAASGSDSQRVAVSNSNTNSSSNISSNISSKSNTNNLSLVADATSEERESYLIAGIFSNHLAASVSDELQRFVDYYDSVGWRTTRGLPITSKIAAARQWDIKNTIPEHLVNLKMRQAYYNAFANAQMLDNRIWTLYRRIEVQGDTAMLIYSADTPPEFLDTLERQCAGCGQVLARALKVSNIRLATLNPIN